MPLGTARGTYIRRGPRHVRHSCARLLAAVKLSACIWSCLALPVDRRRASRPPSRGARACVRACLCAPAADLRPSGRPTPPRPRRQRSLAAACAAGSPRGPPPWGATTARTATRTSRTTAPPCASSTTQASSTRCGAGRPVACAGLRGRRDVERWRPSGRGRLQAPACVAGEDAQRAGKGPANRFAVRPRMPSARRPCCGVCWAA